MNISDVSVNTAGSLLVPGAQQTISVTLKLLNNNEPDLNNDVGEADAVGGSGINFQLTSYIVDVNSTDSDVINHQLSTVTEQLQTGDQQAALGSVDPLEFMLELTVYQ